MNSTGQDHRAISMYHPSKKGKKCSKGSKDHGNCHHHQGTTGVGERGVQARLTLPPQGCLQNCVWAGPTQCCPEHTHQTEEGGHSQSHEDDTCTHQRPGRQSVSPKCIILQTSDLTDVALPDHGLTEGLSFLPSLPSLLLRYLSHNCILEA